MRSYNTNFSFIDFLFILLTGFVALLLIAFMLINPIAKEGKIDPKTKMMVTMEWPDKSLVDVDLWIRGPENNLVSYKRKDGASIVLERDDLGTSNDTLKINGKTVTVQRNMETVSINALLPGEYIVNIHSYTSAWKDAVIKDNGEEYPTPVTVKIYRIDPFELIYTKTTTLEYREEKTILSFVVNEKKEIIDKRTDLFISIVKSMLD